MAQWSAEQLQLIILLLQQYVDDDNFLLRRNQLLALLMEAPDQIGRIIDQCQPNIERERAQGHDRIMRDYFVEQPIYNSVIFRRRFRMRKTLFDRILVAIISSNDYFVQKPDALGLHGLSPIQKMTTTIRMLAYDRSADELDEYIRIAETTSLRCLKEFCKTVITVFGAQYLRTPTAEDMARILRHSASRGFPGMMGSVDCMHWDWKNCPRAWKGQFQGKTRHASLVLEAVATYDLWIWHAFFSMPGTNNDINVLDRSHLFRDLQQGVTPEATFTINNRRYTMCHMLADGIYPKWPVFVKTIKNPLTEKRKYFVARQESARKDIERCFGVLQNRWAILRNPARMWKRQTLHNIMTTCIILHNMIVEDEHNILHLAPEMMNIVAPPVQHPRRQRDARLPAFNRVRVTMRNEQAHHLLQSDLVEHLWQEKGVRG